MDNVLSEYGIDAFAAMLHENAKEKGFWDGEVTYDKLGNKLALVHSEVTEVLEALRKSKGSQPIVEEIADVIIRLLDVYAVMQNEGITNHSLEEVMNEKINKNRTRPALHGNLF